ncbi:hypothetical protein ACAG26_02685 [Mycobacterium sp. pUA109]|uniref:hypothetical protein n=1 Tax=Mycobacterium sp. pUA109 TaxID=3238982 RepID=UPI00351BC44B
MGAGSWVAWAAWAALLLGVVALLYVHRQLQRNRRVTLEQTRPHVGMYMEPHAADWHVIELVVRNFGKTPAYDVQFAFPHPPSVAQYETAADGYADVVPLKLPREIPVLAPGQEWRTVWDSAIDRAELGDAIESHFAGAVTYYGSPERTRGLFGKGGREQFESKVVLDWNDLPPVQRIELMTTHDLAKREKQKLELLRGVLTYFHYASKETRPDVFRSEIDRIQQAVKETQERWRSREHDEPTDVSLHWGDAEAELGKHHN